MWLVRLLAGDIKTLLEWPEFTTKFLPTGIGRSKLGKTVTQGKLRAWINTLTSKMKFEVRETGSTRSGTCY